MEQAHVCRRGVNKLSNTFINRKLANKKKSKNESFLRNQRPKKKEINFYPLNILEERNGTYHQIRI